MGAEMQNMHKKRTNHADPLIQTEFPNRHWLRLEAAIFTLKGKKYLLIVNCYYLFIEIANLTLSKASDVTAHLKSMFARHGLPETLVTDNGLQFACSTVSAFDSMDFGL